MFPGSDGYHHSTTWRSAIRTAAVPHSSFFSSGGQRGHHRPFRPGIIPDPSAGSPLSRTAPLGNTIPFLRIRPVCVHFIGLSPGDFPQFAFVSRFFWFSRSGGPRRSTASGTRLLAARGILLHYSPFSGAARNDDLQMAGLPCGFIPPPPIPSSRDQHNAAWVPRLCI